jgi:hypothetical protein
MHHIVLYFTHRKVPPSTKINPGPATCFITGFYYRHSKVALDALFELDFFTAKQ